MSRLIRAYSTRAVVYRIVCDAGPKGVHIKALLTGIPGLTAKHVENMVYLLARGNYICRPPGEGQRGIYRVDDTCAPAEIAGQELPRLLALLVDCEPGMGTLLLAEQANVDPLTVDDVLAPEVRAGRLVRFDLPRSHGGGRAYRIALPGAPYYPTAPAAPAAPAMPARGRFELTPAGQFVIGWGDGFEVKVPPDVTRDMFRYLDKLGGLHTSAALPTSGAAS